jgi:hypothetical protein
MNSRTDVIRTTFKNYKEKRGGIGTGARNFTGKCKKM